MNDIFSGIRILDITKVFSGPFCTRLFADYGAEVIKIESIMFPDDSRQYPPLKNGVSGYFEMLNRNKKGISLDFRSSDDLRKFYGLCAGSDVIVENMTPSTKKDLHIDYETVRGFKPDIIYASLSGLGQSNDRKYYDILAQAESGLLSLSGTEDTPMKIGPSVTDAFAGLMLAFGISGALHYRNETGFGQYLDVSMLGSSLQLLESYLIEASVTGKNPKRSGNQDSMISPFGLYRTKNGYIAMAAGNDRQWQSLSKFIYEKQIFDLSLFNTNEKRLLNNIQLTSILESVFIRYDSAVLIRQLQELQIACSLLQTMKEVSANTSLIASGDLLQSKIPGLGMCTSPGRNIRFSAVQKHNTAPAPKIGEHNRDYDI